MVFQVIEIVHKFLLVDWSNQGQTFSHRKVSQDTFLYFPGGLIDLADAVFVSQAVLEVYIGSDPPSASVFNFEHEVSEDPQKLRHELGNLSWIGSVVAFASFDLLGEGSDHLYLADGAFVDASDTIVNEISRDEYS